MLSLYNTMSRKKEVFKPLSGKNVGVYGCGPTVYWFQHIGNMRRYVFDDVLRRVLKYDGFTVKYVMNYTDVGHLTSDADEGEDKMEKAAAREGKSAGEIAHFYASAFERDCKKLNILRPDFICKATEHIKEQIELIKTLQEKGYTYQTSDGIYFDTSLLDDYGKLARLKVENLEAGKRVEMGEKKNKTDFALWKFSEKPGLRQQEWDSPFGLGYPGWHIECSAMSMKYLGEQFDIHIGGEEHIPVHHTNEIAQSEAATGKKPWVKYWLHIRWLMFEGEKVSKSKGGLYTVTELEEKGYEPMVFRYFCMGTHYRKPLNFSLAALDSAKQAYDRLRLAVVELKKKEDSKKSDNVYLAEFDEAIEDDINTPQALSVMWNVIRDTKLGSKEKLELLLVFDKVLGFDLVHAEEKAEDVPEDIAKLVRQRAEAKAARNYKEADRLREEIASQGYIIEDSSEGPKVKKK